MVISNPFQMYCRQNILLLKAEVLRFTLAVYSSPSLQILCEMTVLLRPTHVPRGLAAGGRLYTQNTIFVNPRICNQTCSVLLLSLSLSLSLISFLTLELCSVSPTLYNDTSLTFPQVTADLTHCLPPSPYASVLCWVSSIRIVRI
jgi:hypothetical protein